HTGSLEAMVLKHNPEIVTERFHPFMTFANPFRPEFRNEFWILFETKRKDATANAFTCIKDRYVPSRLFKHVRRRESRQTSADDDAGVRTQVDVRIKEKRRASCGDTDCLKKLATSGLSGSVQSLTKHHRLTSLRRCRAASRDRS